MRESQKQCSPKIPLEICEIHENLEIPHENLENHENLRIPLQNQENHENLRIPNKNHEITTVIHFEKNE